MGSDVASIADKYRRQVTMSECYIYKVHNQLTIYCVPPARALKGHHKYSYQSIRALHDPYLYLFCTSYYSDMEHFTSGHSMCSLNRNV